MKEWQWILLNLSLIVRNEIFQTKRKVYLGFEYLSLDRWRVKASAMVLGALMLSFAYRFDQVEGYSLGREESRGPYLRLSVRYMGHEFHTFIPNQCSRLFFEWVRDFFT